MRARLIAYRKFCDRRLLHLDQTCSKAIRRFSAVVRYIHVAIAIALLAWCMLNCSCFFSIAILIVVTFLFANARSKPRKQRHSFFFSRRYCFRWSCVSSLRGVCIQWNLHITNLRSKRFQSSYCAKVRAEAKKKSWRGRGKEETPLPLPRHSFFFLFLSQLSRRTSRGNACYAGYHITKFSV